MTSISDTNVVNAPGGLVELASTSKNTNQTITNGAAAATIMGPLTFVADGSPCIVDLYVPRNYSAGATNFYYLIEIDGAAPAGITQGRLWDWTTTGIENIATSAQFRFIPSAGAHTVTIKAVSVGADVTINTAATNWTPAFLRVNKIIQASQLIVQTPNAPLVTSLPSNAIDGQEVRYLADNTNGIVWNFRYRAGSSSAYKWEFIGGSALKNSYSTQINANNSGFTSCNCSVTLPLAGDYDFDFGAMMESTYNSGQTNVYLNTTGASSSYVISSRNQDTSTRVDSSGASYARIAGISANTSYNLWLNITNATYGWGNYFWLKTVPIRVSA